jgi:hypothetical protein
MKGAARYIGGWLFDILAAYLLYLVYIPARLLIIPSKTSDGRYAAMALVLGATMPGESWRCGSGAGGDAEWATDRPQGKGRGGSAASPRVHGQRHHPERAGPASTGHGPRAGVHPAAATATRRVLSSRNFSAKSG